jgi:hypothetical protein
MYLIQGMSDRRPDKLHTAASDPLVGEYAFANIPATLVDAGIATFKVIVTRKGYQDFAADITVDASFLGGTSNDFIDGVLNVIGNIYLFPISAVPGTVHVHVLSIHQIPVPGVTVLLQQNVTANSATAIVGDRLFPVGGLYTSMSATTDANGVATFAGADLPLVLGGSYIAVAEPIEFQGDELARTSTIAFVIGTNTLHQSISMNSAGPSFFATSASNQLPGSITATGVLSVTFNEPIALTTTGFTAILTSTTGTVVSPVLGVLSNNNQTLTITPTFTTTPTGAGAIVSYGSVTGQIILQNSQTTAQCGAGPCWLFGTGASGVTNNTTGGKVSGVVKLIAN